MNSSITLFIFSIALGLAMADVTYIGNAVNPDYPNQCYYDDLQQPIPINQSFSPQNIEGHCKRIYCRPDLVLQLEFCSRHNMQPNATCKIRSDITLAFPLCCPKMVCENEI